jgi:hypothetical protein
VHIDQTDQTSEMFFYLHCAIWALSVSGVALLVVALSI